MRTAIGSLALLAVCSVAYTQTQAPRGLEPQAAPSLIPPMNVPSTPKAEPSPEKTLDQMLDRLEGLRAQKAELEKAEQELLKEIRRRLEKQSDRISRLGITPADPIAPVVPSTSASSPLVPVPVRNP